MNYTELGELLSKDDHFPTLSKLHKKRLIKMVNRMLYGDYIHKSLLPTNEIGLYSLHSELLRKWYRKNYDSGYYLKVIEPYLECVNESYSFGIGSNGYTKKYRLKDWIYDLSIQQYQNTNKPTDLSTIGKDVKPIRTIPKNGVNELDINGNQKSSTIHINPIVEPNIKMIEQTIEEMENTNSMSIRKHIKRNNLFQLYTWRRTLNNTLYPNGLLQLYQESENGRLNPMRDVDFHHLINTPNRIRRVMFSGSDLYDYDMSNSHLSIFYGLCERYGMDCPYILDYLENKTNYREKWCDDFCVKEKVIKQYIISWLYGNQMNEVRGNPYYKLLGYDRMVKIKKDKTLVGIYREILKGRKLIVQNQPIVNGKIINVMNKELPSDKKLKSQLCFIIFGYETKILEIVNELIGDDMKVMVYDGWIGNKTDVSILETTIKQRLDLDILFDEELIVRPPISELS
jgi:hypothetical protein